MSILYSINYLIFSVFLTLFMLELGLATLALFCYKDYKNRFRQIINPIWEVAGTFAVFYLVNFEVTYPTSLPLIGTAYILPLMIAAGFLIFRNIFLVFGGQLDEKYDKKFAIIYTISTFIVAILVISTLTSAISGIGINVATSSINSSMALNPFNFEMIIALLLISIFFANSIFKIEKLLKFDWFLALLGFAIGIAASYIYAPGIASSLMTYIYLPITAIILLVIGIILRIKRSKYSTAVVALLILFVINTFGILRYPYLIGNFNANNYIASSAIAGPEFLITIIGGGIVAISLAALIYIAYIKSYPENKPEPATQS